ncbi:RNA polymerase I-specific transcription initiation factor RRN3 [Pseudoscourfieldia marina]
MLCTGAVNGGAVVPGPGDVAAGAVLAQGLPPVLTGGSAVVWPFSASDDANAKQMPKSETLFGSAADEKKMNALMNHVNAPCHTSGGALTAGMMSAATSSHFGMAAAATNGQPSSSYTSFVAETLALTQPQPSAQQLQQQQASASEAAEDPITKQQQALLTITAEMRTMTSTLAEATGNITADEVRVASTENTSTSKRDELQNTLYGIWALPWTAPTDEAEALKHATFRMNEMLDALGSCAGAFDTTRPAHRAFVDNWLAISPWNVPGVTREALLGSWCHLAAAHGSLAPHIVEALCAHATPPPALWTKARAVAQELRTAEAAAAATTNVQNAPTSMEEAAAAAAAATTTTTTNNTNNNNNEDEVHRLITAAADAVVMCRAVDVSKSWAGAVAELIRTAPSLYRAVADGMAGQAPHRRQPLGELFAYTLLYTSASERSNIHVNESDGKLLRDDVMRRLISKCVEVDGELRWEDLAEENEELDVDEEEEERAAHAAIAAAVVNEDDDDDDIGDDDDGMVFGAPPSWNEQHLAGGAFGATAAPSFPMVAGSSPLVAGFGEGAAAMKGRARQPAAREKPPSAVSVAKLDRMMALLLEHVSARCEVAMSAALQATKSDSRDLGMADHAVPKSDAQDALQANANIFAAQHFVGQAYESLFPLFESQLLPNNKCKFVHYALFHLLSLESRVCGTIQRQQQPAQRPCLDHFVGRLHQIALDVHMPFSLRRCAVSHLASFGARAKACVQDADAVGLAEAWMAHIATITGPVERLHRILFHGAIYILCFRATRACATSEAGAAAVSRAIALANQVLVRDKQVGIASSNAILLGCPPSIAEEFRSRVISDIGFASDFATTGAYGILCDFIARSAAHRPEGSGSSVHADPAHSATPPLASRDALMGEHNSGIFFPYDPYLLPYSRAQLELRATYLTWSSATRPRIVTMARQATVAQRRGAGGGAPSAHPRQADVGDDIEGDVLLSRDETDQTDHTGEGSERWRMRDGSDDDGSSDDGSGHDDDSSSDDDDDDDDDDDGETPPGIPRPAMHRTASHLSGLRRPTPLSGVRRARGSGRGIAWGGAGKQLAGATRARADSGGSKEDTPGPLYTPPSSFKAPAHAKMRRTPDKNAPAQSP